MKFAKIAKDITGKVIEEGDILFYWLDNHTTWGVVNRIVPRGRDQFPDLEMKHVSSDWKGQNLKVHRYTINAENYHRRRVLHETSLRDDVPSFARLKELRKTIMSKRKAPKV